MNENEKNFRPSIDEIDAELARLSSGKKRKTTAGRVVAVVLVVAALAVLVTTMWLPVLQVVGTSMSPTLSDGEIVFATKTTKNIERGDLIAFYFNEKTLIKRVIGLPGDEVAIDEDGKVFVNGEPLEETYIQTFAEGQITVSFPVTVAPDSYFVLGDNRTVSMDSRSHELGNIYSERIIGKIILRVYPFGGFGTVS